MGTSQWNQQNLPASMTQKGDTWSVEATPNDGKGDGDTQVASITIQNTPPSITSGTILPNNPTKSDTLSVQLLSYDEDGDLVSYLYDWQVNGVSASSLDSMNGSFTKGDSITVLVTPDDGTDLGTTLQVGQITIQNSPPSQPTISISPNSHRSHRYLICSIASSSDDVEPIQYTFSWTSWSKLSRRYDHLSKRRYSAHNDIIAGEDWEVLSHLMMVQTLTIR